MKTEEVSVYRSEEVTPDGVPRVELSKSLTTSYFRLQYAEGAEFFVDKRGTQVWGSWLETLAVEDAWVYLLGPIMGFVLRLRGFTSLHASAISVQNRAVLFVGPPGAGKSTTAAAFAGFGYPILSDDIVPIFESDSSFWVQSGYPCLCLWPKSVRSLFGSADALPSLTPTWDKRYLALGNSRYQFQREPLPLGGVYFFGTREDDSARPFVQAIPTGPALMGLMANTYMNYLPDAEVEARDFKLFGRLLRRVPVRRVQPHADAAHLARLCEVVIEDLRNLESTGAVGDFAPQNQTF
ncbi:MAG TPA: hypothetical protein VKT71_12445 [Candidatus Acidoferrales bacterium]|nr:hypothetical protein [Candidatus Acidoferrales bacterium]